MDWTHATGPKGEISGRADKFLPMSHPDWVDIKNDPKNLNEDEKKDTESNIEEYTFMPKILGGGKKHEGKVIKTSNEFREMV
jgi:hypothetical protein